MNERTGSHSIMATQIHPSSSKIAYNDIDQAITQFQKQGRILYWRGWSLCWFDPTNLAKSHNQGVYRNGRWGFETVFEVCDDGSYEIEFTRTRVSRGSK
jgi:hypothetical protein